MVYHVFARSMPAAAPTSGTSVTVRRRPLPLTEGRLAEHLARATLCGVAAPDDYPLFVEEAVVPQSVRRSWTGRGVEGGAWLVGNLYRQTEPPEIFGVIHTVLDAVGMTHARDQLDLSTQTYLHLEDQLDRRRNRMGRVGELPLAFMHSHPFPRRRRTAGRIAAAALTAIPARPLRPSSAGTMPASIRRSSGPHPMPCNSCWD